MSCSSPDYNSNLHDAIIDAYSTGVTFIGSAGNDGSSANYYPACHPEVIGVAATNNSGEVCSWSNNNNIDICAPGSNILALSVDDEYQYVSGTSFSAPMVAGAAALMQSIYVHDTLSPAKIKEILCDNATDLSDVNEYDNDLLNVGRAVEYTRYLAMKHDTLKIRSVVLSNKNKSKLRWYDLDFSSCDGYKIYRSTSENGTYSAVADIKFGETLWDEEKGCNYWYDNASQSGNTYYYKVRAYVKYGTGKKYSNYTAVKSITIP